VGCGATRRGGFVGELLHQHVGTECPDPFSQKGVRALSRRRGTAPSGDESNPTTAPRAGLVGCEGDEGLDLADTEATGCSLHDIAVGVGGHPIREALESKALGDLAIG